MSLKSMHIAVLVDNYFEQAEFESPINYLRYNHSEVSVISVKEMNLQAMNHVNLGDKFTADYLIDEVDPKDFDAIILPGGVVNSDRLRMDVRARDWINSFINDGKLIAAICHAPWLLVSADAVEDRRLTSYFTLQDDIRNAGGEWIDQPVIIDGNLITSRKPDDLNDFNEAIRAWFHDESNFNAEARSNTQVFSHA